MFLTCKKHQSRSIVNLSLASISPHSVSDLNCATPSLQSHLQARNCDMEAGSVGLIMENRPNTLPAKTAGEQLKHKQEYQRMVSAAKKKGKEIT